VLGLGLGLGVILSEKNSESRRESNYRVFLPTSRSGSCRRHRGYGWKQAMTHLASTLRAARKTEPTGFPQARRPWERGDQWTTALRLVGAEGGLEAELEA